MQTPVAQWLARFPARPRGIEPFPDRAVGSAMTSHAGRTTSVWMATATLPSFPALANDLYADVCVIGAGVS